MLAQRWQTLVAEAAAAEPKATASGRSAAALVDDLQPLRFQGPDVLNFLQGYLTIDLDRLSEDSPQLAALTNLKGRVVATGWCQREGDGQIDWLIHRDLVAPVGEFMARYLAFSKTRLVSVEEDAVVMGIVAPDQPPVARLISSEADLDQLATSCEPVPAVVWRRACIEQGLALIEPATSEAFLPQMIGLVEAGAVDFDKGCYLGQEVVARAQHRGEVKRRLLCLTGAASQLQPGTPLTDENGKECGTVLTCEMPLCLAVARQPSASGYQAAGTPLSLCDQSFRTGR